MTFPFDPNKTFFVPHQISINNKTKDINRQDIEAVAKLVGIRNYNQIIDKVIAQTATFGERIKEYDFLRGDEEYKWKWTNDYRMTISFSIFQQKLSNGIRVVLDNLRMEIVRSLKGKRNSRTLK